MPDMHSYRPPDNRHGKRAHRRVCRSPFGSRTSSFVQKGLEAQKNVRDPGGCSPGTLESIFGADVARVVLTLFKAASASSAVADAFSCSTPADAALVAMEQQLSFIVKQLACSQ